MLSASRLIERPILRRDSAARVADASPGLRLAAAVAGFGQLLRGRSCASCARGTCTSLCVGGAWMQNFQYTDVEKLARSARGDDPHGYERGFEQLVAQAASLTAAQARVDTED